MRAKELVGGADEEVTLKRADINEVVGCVVNRVDICQRTVDKDLIGCDSVNDSVRFMGQLPLAPKPNAQGDLPGFTR
jgi:hypothetical protein